MTDFFIFGNWFWTNLELPWWHGSLSSQEDFFSPSFLQSYWSMFGCVFCLVMVCSKWASARSPIWPSDSATRWY